MSGPATEGRPLDSEKLAQTKTEARRLVSLLHQPVVRMEEVSSTVRHLVELTSSLGVYEYAKTYPGEGPDPSKDRADQEMQRARNGARGREPEPEETPAPDPTGQDLSEEEQRWVGDDPLSG